MATAPTQPENLGSKNAFRQPVAGISSPAEHEEKQLSPHNDEKQVATSEALSGADNAPIPVEPTPSMPRTVEREADKEVTSSWQTQSREQSAPIPMVYHESNSPGSARGEQLFNDVKGPPPAYDAINSRESSTTSTASTPLTTPTSLEPESPQDDLPLRPEDKSTVGQLLTWIPPAPRSLPQSARLTQPVIIPQLDVPPERESVPFQRCYSDALAAHGVPIDEFTRFLDGLQIAQLPNSALQSLRMLGVGVQHVPIPVLSSLTGRGLSALGSSGSGHSGSRARLYLEQARERYFKPRGLRISIVKDDELNPRLQIPAHAARLGILTQNTLSATCCQRRLEALAPYTAPLRFDVADQDKQIQGVQRMARKHLNARLKDKARHIDTLRKRQWEHTAFAAGTWDVRYRDKLSAARNAQDELIRTAKDPGWREKGSAFEVAREEVRVRQREWEVVVSERQNQGRDDEAVAAEMEEVRWVRRLRWLVVESL